MLGSLGATLQTKESPRSGIPFLNHYITWLGYEQVRESHYTAFFNSRTLAPLLINKRFRESCLPLFTFGKKLIYNIYRKEFKTKLNQSLHRNTQLLYTMLVSLQVSDKSLLNDEGISLFECLFIVSPIAKSYITPLREKKNIKCVNELLE